MNLVQTFEKENVTQTSNFGDKVYQLGDINNDGFDDIGIYNYEKYVYYQSTYESRYNDYHKLYIYFGSSNPDTEIDYILYVNYSYEHGSQTPSFRIISHGDIDGDGYFDIIFADKYNLTVYNGGPSFDDKIDYIINISNIMSKNPGWVYDIRPLGLIGDYNNDDCDDILWNNTPFYSYVYMESFASIFKGSKNPSSESEYKHFSHDFDEYSIGDINGDGYSDLMYLDNATDIKVYFGNDNFDLNSEVIYSMPWTNKIDRCKVLGDINNDGYDDFIIEDWIDQEQTINCFLGGNYILKSMFSKTDENTIEDFIPAGDINNDGYADVMLYCEKLNKVDIVLGNSWYSLRVPNYTLIDETSDSNFGLAASSAGDINGDGFDDIMISKNEGVYLYLGGENFSTLPSLEYSLPATQNYFAWSGSGVDDTNLDGVDDFILGAFGYDNNTGRGYLFYGANPMNDLPAQIFNGYDEGYYHGISVSGAGDVNGDGYKDIIIGAEGAPNGEAKIYFGGDQVDATSDIRLQGKQSGSFFGQSVLMWEMSI